MWEEIGVIVIPLVLQRTSRKKRRLQPKATWVDVLDGVCMVVLHRCVPAAHVLCVSARLFFPHIHPISLGLHGEFQSPDEEEGVLWLQSCSPIAVAGLWGAYCVCACLQALSVCIELGETETERAGNQS